MEFSIVSSSEDDLLSVVEQPASTSVVVLNPCSASNSVEGNDVVFGSFLVDRNSSTPYTDATQVREIKSNSSITN